MQKSHFEIGKNYFGASTYINSKVIWSRTITICLGSFFIGFTLVYYYTMTSWYCNALNQQASCNNNSYYLVAAIIPLTAMISSLCICPLLEKYFSRRYILIINSSIGVLGSVLMFVAFHLNDDVLQTFESPWLIVGRIFHGFAVGIFMTFCLVTLNQFAPYQLKMQTIGMYQISIVFGIVVTNTLFPVLVKSFFSDQNFQWKVINSIMFGGSIFVLFLQIFLLIFKFKEQSPIYLLKKGNYDKARSVISHIYHSDFAQQKFLELKAGVQHDQSCFEEDYNTTTIFWKGIFFGVYAIFTQQMSGINFLNTIGLYDVLSTGNTSYLNIFLDVIPEICQLLGTILLLVVNRFQSLRQNIGRSSRMFLIKAGTICSCVVMAAAFILELIPQTVNKHERPEWLVLQCCFMLGYGFTLGPVCWLYVSQLLDCRQIQIVISVHWVLAFVNMFAFPLIEKKFHFLVPLILLIINLCLIIFHRWYLIETKNKSALELIRSIDAFSYLFWKKQT